VPEIGAREIDELVAAPAEYRLIGSGRQEAARFLLDPNEAERAVVEDDDLGRQAELRQAEEVSHQHGEAAIARQRDDLAAGKGRLRADGLRHRVCHRAVPERTDQAPLAVQREVARRPDGRQPDIAGEDGVVVGEIADRLGDLLRMGRALAGPANGESSRWLRGETLTLGNMRCPLRNHASSARNRLLLLCSDRL
jgi:hypothetical protein